MNFIFWEIIFLDLWNLHFSMEYAFAFEESFFFCPFISQLVCLQQRGWSTKLSLGGDVLKQEWRDKAPSTKGSRATLHCIPYAPGNIGGGELVAPRLKERKLVDGRGGPSGMSKIRVTTKGGKLPVVVGENSRENESLCGRERHCQNLYLSRILSIKLPNFLRSARKLKEIARKWEKVWYPPCDKEGRMPT